MGVKVTLTVEAGNGKRSHLEAEGQMYEEVKAAAEARMPEGPQAILIRTA